MMKKQILISTFLGALLVSGAGALLTLYWARGIFRPIERMHATIGRIDAGDERARVGDVASRDELGRLATAFDRLLDEQAARRAELQALNASLDRKVAERTADLAAANEELRAAQRRLVMSEKLAAIGELTAGVAHEISNPTAVIQGNLDILIDVLGPQGCEPVRDEIRLIREQIHRIRMIVAKLLQFSRPTEYVGYLEPIALDALVQDGLLLVGHLLRRTSIAVTQQLDSSRLVVGNKGELQQVLINLLVNAIQAMPEGGVLTLSSEDWDEAGMPIGVRLSVSDTGPGIPPAHLDKLFQPFFTADKADGNGLGLWVSQGIVERYGGNLTAANRPEGGSCFTVWLRLEALG